MDIISAAPGYYVLAYHRAGFVTRDPVVGWRVEPTDRHATPIVLDPERCYQYTNPPILCPDGQVISSFERAWDSEQLWLADKQKENAGLGDEGRRSGES